MLVKFEQRTDINAPVETVWSIVSDPKTWPLWFPEVEQVTNLSAVATGSTFQWQKGGEEGTGSILHVDSDAMQIKVIVR